MIFELHAGAEKPQKQKHNWTIGKGESRGARAFASRALRHSQTQCRKPKERLEGNPFKAGADEEKTVAF